MKRFQTEQEQFWAGEFGDEYIARNRGARGVANNVALFAEVFSHTRGINSAIEFGANIGMNLRAIRQLLPEAELAAVEINAQAVAELKQWNEVKKIYHQSILDFVPDGQRAIAFTKGVLIHLNPDVLPIIYELLYQSSRKYILIAEYFNPTPVEVSYRGHEGKLFKRDFAGEMLDQFKDLTLVTYGFCYRRDPQFPQDNLNWFLLQKPNTA